jgi:hypothetical protein
MSKATIKYSGVMQINLGADTAASTSLAPGQVMGIRNPKARTIVCTSGRLWVTRENDPDDHILDEHQGLELRPAGKLVVTALGRGSFRLE